MSGAEAEAGRVDTGGVQFLRGEPQRLHVRPLAVAQRPGVLADPGEGHAPFGAGAAACRDLSEEHERLDLALDRLADIGLTGAKDHDGGHLNEDDRHALREAAVAVRDSVRDHLDHEEPVLFPALREHITPAQWVEFAQRVIATTPPVAGHLMIGLLDEVGTPAAVESIFVNMPAPMKPLLPALRDQAAADLRVLRGTGS